MQRTTSLLATTALLWAALLPFAPAAHAQSDGEKALAAQPFTIVAPFPPGGPIDSLARILANGLSERYKQTAVVDNRTGANGNIGIDLVKRAAPTGHTLLVVPAGNLTINPTLMPKLGYSVDGDFAPVPSDTGYRGPIAHRVAGITYRQLDYWARTGLVVPEVRPAGGSGTQRAAPAQAPARVRTRA